MPAKYDIYAKNALTVEKSTKRKNFDRWAAVRGGKRTALEMAIVMLISDAFIIPTAHSAFKGIEKQLKSCRQKVFSYCGH